MTTKETDRYAYEFAVAASAASPFAIRDLFGRVQYDPMAEYQMWLARLLVFPH